MSDATRTPRPKKSAEKAKRVRRDPEVARRLILDAAERLMRDEGYAAVSTRSVAKAAGLAPALVHYYYPVTDDLFVALHARMTSRQSAELRAVLAAPDPLRALWDYQTTWSSTSLGVEFMALANHRKSIRDSIARRTEDARAELAALLAQRLRLREGMPVMPDADAIAVVLTGLARTLTNERSIGITRGHDGVRAVVEWGLRQIGVDDAPDKEGPDGETSRA